MVYMITYGSGDPNDKESLTRLDAGIKTLGNWSARIPNCWILEVRDMNAGNIRDRLRQFINDERGDRIFVARISRNWAGRNMGAGFPDWLKGRDFGTFTNPTPEAKS